MFLLEAKALLSLLFCVIGLACLLRRRDPIELVCRWLYAFRRIVYIVGTMAWDSGAEFRFRWESQKPQDVAAIAELEAEFPAGPERT